MISGWRVGLALLLPFAVGALQWVLWDPWIKPFSWLLFYPAAFCCAWIGGLAAGELAFWIVLAGPYALLLVIRTTRALAR